MQRRTRLLITVILVLGGAGSLAAGVHQDEAQVLLKAASHQELVQGDLDAAIETYQKILDQYPGERNVAAEALLKLGMSYEKLGKNEAKEAYERLLSDYADQSEQVEQARTRLKELEPAGGLVPTGPTMKRIWVNSDKNIVADFTGTPSPDGRYFSFVEWGTGDVAVFDLLSGTYRYLTREKPWSFPNMKGAAHSSAFSRDGSEVAYSFGLVDGAGWELRIVAAQEENRLPPRSIFKTSYRDYLHVNDWSPDGKGILVSFEHINDQSGLGFVMPDTGKLTVLKVFERFTPYTARFSPDGKYIAYDFPPDHEKEARDIYLLASDGSNEERVIAHPADDRLIDWSPTGDRLIFASDRGGKRGVWAQPVADGKAVAGAKLVKGDVGNERFIGITKQGHIYSSSIKGLSDIFTAQWDPEGGELTQPPKRLPSLTEGNNRAPAWSPDGRFLAYKTGASNFAGRLVIRSLEDGLEEADSVMVSGRLAWSPDSKYILCNAKVPSRHWALHLFERSTGKFRLVREPTSEETILYPGAWSPDGKEIYFSSCCSPRSVLARNLETGVERKIFQLSKETFKAPAPSPDARSLALFERDGSEIALKLVSTVNGEARNLYQIPDTESQPHSLSWAPDGLFIYFTVQREKRSQELWRVSVEGGEATSTGLSYERSTGIAFHPNGRQLAFTSGESKDELWVMENFLEPKQ